MNKNFFAKPAVFLRRLVSFVFCSLLIFLLFSVMLLPVSAADYSDTYSPESFSDFHGEDLTLYAKSAVLIDADTGRILYGKSANTPMANASTTKILTCILALENGNPEDVVTVSDYACTMPEVKMGFSSGDQFYLKDLLYALMLESYNDAAAAIAEQIAGSVEGFADMMNQKARELGCENSHFITPNGLDAEDGEGAHETTAYDLARIMAYCILNEEFLEITQTDSKQVSTVDGTKSFSLSNHNALLTMVDGALSGKTGFTSKAGYCYVGAFRSGDHTCTFALLACGWPNNRNYKWSDSRQLISYADSYYSDRVILQDEKALTLPLNGAVSGTDNIQFPDSITAKTTDEAISGFLSESDQIEIVYDLPEEIDAPARKGTVIGTEKIYLNQMLYASREVTLAESAELFDYSWCLRWVLRRAAI